LRVEPKAANRGEVERHIVQLNKLIAAQAQAQSAPPIAPLPTEAKPDKSKPPVVASTEKPPAAERPPAVERPVVVAPPVGERQPAVEHPVVVAPPAGERPVVASDNRLVAVAPQKPIYKKGWFWGAVAGGVVVVTVAVVLGVVLSSSGDSTKTLPAARF